MNNLDNLEYDLKMKKIREEVLKSFSEYRKTLNYMSADAPIGVLCLPKSIENILINNGYLRVYDLFDANFTEIKGLGKTRIGEITACVDQFLTMF